MTSSAKTESKNPQKIYLKDYQAPLFEVEYLNLHFNLNEDFTLVSSEMRLKGPAQTEVQLDGESLDLVSIEVQGKSLLAGEFKIDEGQLRFLSPANEFTVKVVTRTQPQENTSLEGLYKSNGIFCTQCEAQGFRKITYFFDRPDVMTKYRVTIEADQKKYPVLLSNGNRIETKILAGGRHQITWEDPFKKPCYLFALVAGDLGCLKDTFVTLSGRKVALEIYAAHGEQDRCQFAMESLKKSMKWDEERFGREYDLDIYMILAVDDFNAGAMENKGLNIFNSRLIFANPQTATDSDYFAIESVVAHEYFHNWTGNRVTLRDWFHLSLKEGLTVFRDQEFSMDQSSRGLIRIENVQDLRDSQFAEDAGPNAHPIRPAYCYAVDNFFTSTIYEKGSEVIRMMQTMVGRPGFRKGMDLYFQRHDGQAVIIEDFARAIADANQQNWEQFKLWYSQAGTPKVEIEENFDSANSNYQLKFKQSCELTALEKSEGIAGAHQESNQGSNQGSTDKKPFHIPLVLGLISSSGEEISIENKELAKNSEGQTIFHLKTSEAVLNFKGLTKKPTLSINRQFSAPIHLSIQGQSEADLLFLMEKDSDSFNQWESAQKVYLSSLRSSLSALPSKQEFKISQALIQGLRSVLKSEKIDTAMKAELLQLPSLDYWSQMETNLRGDDLQLAFDQVSRQIAMGTEDLLLEIYERYHGKNTDIISNAEFANRRLKNRALALLAMIQAPSSGIPKPTYRQLIFDQFTQAKNMTDYQSAFGILIDLDIPERLEAIHSFHQKWKQDSLVLNKWFAIQAMSNHADTFSRVQSLMAHPDFNIKNPNRVYSLLRTFGGNFAQFHQMKNNPYDFYADQVIQIDKLNPQVAARLAGNFDIWTQLDKDLKEKAHRALSKMLGSGLSSNTHEIIKNNFDAGQTLK